MWDNLNFLIGTWKGIGAGQPGNSTVERSYQLILNDRFLEVKSKSIYPPQSQNPQGEVHSETGFVQLSIKHASYIILRQFHVEGFVNQYALDYLAPDGKIMVFTSESIENIQPGWRAKETYQVISSNEFAETFELADPEKTLPRAQ